jgi:UDP-glucose 4-epimerase
VGDVVQAQLIVGGNDLGGAFNVGRGEETSVLDLIEILGSFGDQPFEAEFAPARPGEVLRNALDPSRSKEVLGFEAKMPLSDGLRTTLDSFREEASAKAA